MAELLATAFELARAGTLAAEAGLVIEELPVQHFSSCGAETGAHPNRLLCGQCGELRTRLISGDELVLASLELTLADPAPPEGNEPCATPAAA